MSGSQRENAQRSAHVGAFPHTMDSSYFKMKMIHEGRCFVCLVLHCVLSTNTVLGKEKGSLEILDTLRKE